MSARRTDHRRSRPPRRRQPSSTLSSAPSRSANPSPPSSSPSRDPRRSRSSTGTPTPLRQVTSSSTPAPSEPDGQETAETAETALIRAGYQPAYNPPTPTPGANPTPQGPSSSAKKKKKKKKVRFDMAEPRARAARHKGQMNFGPEMRLLLLAYGDPAPHPSFPSEPLPETVRVLDEIVTDFILELCHGAAQVAHHARRQKIKVDDFRFALRRDSNKLGRVQELLRMERELKEARKAFDQNDDQVAKDAGKKGAAAAAALEEVDEGASTVAGGKKGKGKGKRAAAVRRGSDATEESVSKKRKTLG